MKKFVNSIPAIFLPEVEREKRALAKIEKARQAREARQAIVIRAADLRDKLTEANSKSVAVASNIDKLADWPVESLYEMFIAGQISAEQLGERLAQVESVARHAGEIKKRIHKHFVETAERELAEYEKQNASALKDIKLREADEVVPVPVPINDGAVIPEPPSAGVRLMLNLKPGETFSQSPPFEVSKPASGGSLIADDDDD